MARLRLLAAAALTLAGLHVLPAQALESAAATSPRATVTMVTDSDTLAPGRALRLGLRLRMAPGWHTYWRNSGDAGAPTEFEPTLPAGMQAGPIAWPAPKLLTEGQLATYGYTGEALLPVPVMGTSAAMPAAITAHAHWLVCSNICVPEEAEFRLVLPAGPAAPSAEAPLFAAADRQMPRPSPFPARIAPDGTLSVTGAGLLAAGVRHVRFFPDAGGAIVEAAAQALSTHDGGFTLALKPGPQFDPAGLTGVLEIEDAGGQTAALQIAATAGAPPAFATPTFPPDPAAVPVALTLGRMLALAFLGGLVLNLMPCVFPVLAMKAVGILRLSAAGRGAVRLHALAYSAGVLVAFAGLGGLMLAARTAGIAAGWGFQFQSPVFVAGVTWLLFAVGLSLSGVFQVGGRLAGAGQALAARPGYLGSGFTGMLAVVVATPCTAPFMGAAVAAALTAPPSVTIGVFLALGLGLAAPYLLLAAFPAVARAAPRPGQWMEVLKQALAFPMYAAVAWLVWVIARESGPAGVLGSVAGLVLVGFAAWAFGLAQGARGPGRRFGQGASLAAALAAAAVLAGVATAPVPAAQSAEATPADTGPGQEEPYSAARLAALRAEGRPVFVNMTAAWCVTCLVNERVAIETAGVRHALTDRHIAYLKGDWTRQDPAITEFLAQHGRDGVPLYVFYPAGGGAAVVLPQILTEGLVLDGLSGAPPT